MKWKFKLAGMLIIILFIIGIFVYFKYFFSYEERNIFERKLETITGQNLTVTIFDVNGKMLKQWKKIKKVTSGGADKNYVFFYTDDGKYVQIPHSLWYIIEEE